MDLNAMIKANLPKIISQTSPTIAQDAMESYELASLKMSPEVSSETQFIQQEMQARFFSGHQPNDRCLIIHGLGSGKCVHPDTIIRTFDGSIDIHSIWRDYSGNLVRDNEIPHAHWATLRAPLHVKSFNTVTQEIVTSRVTNLFRQFIQEPMRKIITNEGVIQCTFKHRLYTASGWTNDLHTGQYVARFNIENGQMEWSVIKQIETEYYIGFVYDLEVERYHAYVANEYITHNTCTATLIHERFKYLLHSKQQRPPAIVLVPNVEYIAHYENEIVNTCAKDTYKVPQEIIDLQNELRLGHEQHRNPVKAYVRKMLKQHYIFKGIDQFASEIEPIHYEVNENGNQQRKGRIDYDDPAAVKALQRQYYGVDFIIDEGHRVQPKIDIFQKFYHTVIGIRLFILTGTPIWDKVSELPKLYNLLLPLDNQFENPNGFVKEYYEPGTSNMREDKREEFKNRIRGLTSYLRTRLLNTKIYHDGVTHEGLANYYPVQPCIMSDFQEKIVKRLWKAPDHIDIDESESYDIDDEISVQTTGPKADVIADAALRGPRDASMFVFPDGTYGSEGFRKHVQFIGMKANEQLKGKLKQKAALTYEQQARFQYKDPKVIHEITNNLQKYSTKFYEMIKRIQENPKEVTVLFFENVASGGGCANLGLIMENMIRKDGKRAFIWARRKADIIIPREENDPMRFVVFSSLAGTTRGADIGPMLEIINSPENRYGDLCNVIIITRKLAVGTNIKNVRSFAQSPFFNMSLSRQAQGRSERSGGHDALPVNERYIHQSMMVAVFKGPEMLPNGQSISKQLSIDMYVHQIAEAKDRKNADAFKALIESCWDCALTYGRNVMVDSYDYSPECFYQECNYYCDGYDREYIDTTTNPWTYQSNIDKMDYSNALIFYPDANIAKFKNKLLNLFHHYFMLSLSGIYVILEAYNSFDQYNILNALHDMIVNHVPIYNRYGQVNYIREYRNWYYLTFSLGETSFEDHTLTSAPLLQQSLSLREVLVQQAYDTDLPRMEQIWSKAVEQWTRDEIETLHFDSIIAFVEHSIHQSEEFAERLHELYPEHIMRWSPNGKSTSEDPTGWVHDFYFVEYYLRGLPPISKYKAALKKNKNRPYRIIDPKNYISYWRTALFEESKDIHKLFTSKTTSEEKLYRNPKTVTRDEVPGGVFGFINENNKFSIRRIQGPGEHVTSGGVCVETSWTIDKILALMMDLGYYPPPKEKSRNETREELQTQLLNLLRKHKSEDEINALTTKQMESLIFVSERNKGETCRDLEKWMREQTKKHPESNLFMEFKI